MSMCRSRSRNIIFLRADDWVRVISIASMIQCGAFVAVGGGVLLGRLSGYRILSTDTLYIIIGVSVSIAGFYLGVKLYHGVEKRNPKMLLAWMFYAVYIQFLLVLNFGIYLCYYPNSLNWANVLGVMFCLLIYGFFLFLVNIHRKELLLDCKNQEQRDREEVELKYQVCLPPGTPLMAAVR